MTWRVLALLSSVFLLALGPATATEPLVLEVAPSDLGSTRSESTLLLAAEPGSKELLLFDADTGTLQRFLESGDRWGDPVELRDATGQPFRRKTMRMAVTSDSVALVEGGAITVFDSRGQQVARSEALRLVSDITPQPLTGWIVALRQMPLPGGSFFGWEDTEEPPPRLLWLDDELRVSDQGLAADKDRDGNRAAGESLRLTWGRDRLFAAELANYRIYELNSNGKLRATYEDPEHSMASSEATQIEVEVSREDSTVPEEARRFLESRGRDLTAPEASAPSQVTNQVTAASFHYEPVIRAVGWEPQSGRLVLLLAKDTLGPGPALDFFDPLTGEIERFHLVFPAEMEGAIPVSQLVVGARYLWIRNHRGSTPTLRVDRYDSVEGGTRLTIPEVRQEPEDGIAEDTK